MDIFDVKCKCNQTFPEKEFSLHFHKCSEFKTFFKEFDSDFGKLLKHYSQPQENLLIIRVLLDQYKCVIENKIRNMKPQFNDQFIRKEEPLQQQQPKKPQIVEKNNDDDITLCSSCKYESMIDIYLDCLHPMCKRCFYKMAEENFSSMLCPKCQFEISYQYKKDILGEDYNKFEQIALKKLIGENYVICPNMQCKTQVQFEKGSPDYKSKNEKGELLSRLHCEHYAENRCRCPYCKADFCVSCKIMPYHLGRLLFT